VPFSLPFGCLPLSCWVKYSVSTRSFFYFAIATFVFFRACAACRVFTLPLIGIDADLVNVDRDDKRLQIGCFALIGIIGVAAAPFVGKAIDQLIPWTGVLLGISIILISQVIYTASAGLSVISVAFVVFCTSFGTSTKRVKLN
jgi:hypothetical protein